MANVYLICVKMLLGPNQTSFSNTAFLTGRSTVSGFDLAWFRSLFSEHLCIIGLYAAILHITFFVTFVALSFSELSRVGLALDVVD